MAFERADNLYHAKASRIIYVLMITFRLSLFITLAVTAQYNDAVCRVFMSGLSGYVGFWLLTALLGLFWDAFLYALILIVVALYLPGFLVLSKQYKVKLIGATWFLILCNLTMLNHGLSIMFKLVLHSGSVFWNLVFFAIDAAIAVYALLYRRGIKLNRYECIENAAKGKNLC